MPELALLVLGLAALGTLVMVPVLRARPDEDLADDEAEADELRHRVALEALRDVEADRRAGSLDESSYAAQRAEAEARAAQSRVALERPPVPPTAAGRPVRRLAILAGAAIGALLLAGWLVPPTGVANQTATNDALARAEAAEDARHGRIGDLLETLAENPDDVAALSDLADAYLAGSTAEDLRRAVVTLQALRSIEPERPDVYERIIGAYLRAGDGVNARAALESYRDVAKADPVEVAFLDGLIALRTEHDSDAAIAAFERFLELAPDDERAGMVRSLRDQAAEGR